MKVILCGYNWTGCKALELLLNKGVEVFVFTHENPSHINSLINYCNKRKVPFSLERIKESNLPFKPDVVASIYYRYIIAKDIIESCNNKIFNLHPSLLPQYRGCSSLTWAMINGEKKAGFTYHYINESVDDGKIILQKTISIAEWDTQQTLYHRVMFESMKYFNKVLTLVLKGFEGTSQNLSKATYYNRACPFNGEINNNWELEKVERFIRAMIYPPLPYAKFKGKEVFNIEEYLKICDKDI